LGVLEQVLAMKRETLATIVSMAVSLTALTLVVLHASFRNLGIDITTVSLLAIAALPWLGSILKSIELPGVLKIEYQQLVKIGEEAAKAKLLAPPPKVKPTYVTLAREDPNLALAALRLEIEKRLRLAAQKRGLAVDLLSVGPLLRQLQDLGMITEDEHRVLGDLLSLLNRAVHGADVDSKAADWAVNVGSQLLAALDQRWGLKPD
jgi:hypothetical protein